MGKNCTIDVQEGMAESPNPGGQSLWPGSQRLEAEVLQPHRVYDFDPSVIYERITQSFCGVLWNFIAALQVYLCFIKEVKDDFYSS